MPRLSFTHKTFSPTAIPHEKSIALVHRTSNGWHSRRQNEIPKSSPIFHATQIDDPLNGSLSLIVVYFLINEMKISISRLSSAFRLKIGHTRLFLFGHYDSEIIDINSHFYSHFILIYVLLSICFNDLHSSFSASSIREWERDSKCEKKEIMPNVFWIFSWFCRSNF